MVISIDSALDEVAVQAQGKAALLKSPVRYAVQAALAGAFVGVAVVLMAATAGPFLASANPGTKLVQGSVFGIALTLVVFAGAELFTGANMVMLIGWLKGTVRGVDALLVNVAALIGNLVGAILFAGMVHASGVLDAVAKKGGKPAGDGLITSIVASKMHATDGQLFWRAVLCNMLVCLGLWMAARTKSDTAKLIVLFWVLLAFIASGFEHSVANMTIFALAVMHGDATWGDLTHNLLLTVPGNVVGGAIVVAAGYLLSAVPKRSAPEPTVSPTSSVRSETQEMAPVS
jgi:nitrite transporter NirC